jgi:hypothetical protein
VKAAHEDGMGICFGRHAEYSEAAHLADRSFPWLPDKDGLSGQPCQDSGLYPTTLKTHPMIARRIGPKSERLDRYFERDLLRGLSLPSGLNNEGCEFFHDVETESGKGRFAAAALGLRNRWAVIYMDGNDMGAQYSAATSRLGKDAESFARWLGAMSHELDECSRKACRDAMQHVIDAWAAGEDGRKAVEAATDKSSGVTTLPLRPLVVGGDDLAVLCHVRHALEFVSEACRAFAERSACAAREAGNQNIELWPATGGRLTISAGILFAPVTLPLSSAIPYAELLLASAKGRGRKLKKENEPAPACVDWESVTEGLIDTPHARRQRELVFTDDDIGESVELTRRPYQVEELANLDALADSYREEPSTVRHQVLEGLRAGYWDRQVFVNRLGKRKNNLVKDLDEGDDMKNPSGRWKIDQRDGGKRARHTDVVDALLLLEEDSRMSRTTAKEGQP